MLAPWSARACCGGMMASSIYYSAQDSGGGALHAAAMTMRMVDGEQHDTVSISSGNAASPPTPLRFEFRGYSVWLEIEDVNGDLDKALDVAAQELHVHRVPSPHVTVEYGMTHLDETEMRRRFHEELPLEQLQGWPDFPVRGVQTGMTWNGVDGEEMDMAWIEMTLGTSPAHETMVNAVRSVFYRDTSASSRTQSNNSKWTPHLSLCYENPEQAKSNLHYSMSIMARVPTLTEISQRRITGIALWKTEGTMELWKCLERFDLRENNDISEDDDPASVGVVDQ